MAYGPKCVCDAIEVSCSDCLPYLGVYVSLPLGSKLIKYIYYRCLGCFLNLVVAFGGLKVLLPLGGEMVLLRL